MFSIMHAFLHCFKPGLHSEVGAIDVNQRFWLLNQISVDII